MKKDLLFLLVCNYAYKFIYCRIAQIPEVINHIKKSFLSESNEETTSESTTCTDKENDVNKTLETVIEPLKVFTFKTYYNCCLYFIFYYPILERTGTLANKGIYV